MHLTKLKLFSSTVSFPKSFIQVFTTSLSSTGTNHILLYSIWLTELEMVQLFECALRQVNIIIGSVITDLGSATYGFLLPICLLGCAILLLAETINHQMWNEMDTNHTLTP
ncbi:hypothetical protein CDAR_24381 [Caerostris darwini]|uniref:Uncharacterized protein n=1 Tax=Caerostris darwini TaxID=1538125 RepID=A0AAV4QFB7_9ARAC|nr:hypothetical protein CDAR_24381 [Caerostris darwini]